VSLCHFRVSNILIPSVKFTGSTIKYLFNIYLEIITCINVFTPRYGANCTQNSATLFTLVIQQNLLITRKFVRHKQQKQFWNWHVVLMVSTGMLCKAYVWINADCVFGWINSTSAYVIKLIKDMSVRRKSSINGRSTIVNICRNEIS
jgi:hypothetical protein